jgi:hypothetical protein
MKTLLTLQAAVLLLLAMGSTAAEIEYQHPNLTILAQDEPLDAVLKSVSKEMRIFVTTPTGLNPVVNCDIQNQPIELAFKKLLGDMSYSLQWKDNGETLVGLTILTGTGNAVANTSTASKISAPSAEQPVSSIMHPGNQSAAVQTEQGNDAVQLPEYDAGMGAELDEREARMEAEREEREVRMAQERTTREAEMVIRREEEMKAHKASMDEDVIRNEAELAEYFAAQGN